MALADIVAYRKSKKLSRKALAKRAGISEATLWYIEKGRTSPKLDTVYAIADALGIPAELLVKR